jgi:hypothetical protein
MKPLNLLICLTIVAVALGVWIRLLKLLNLQPQLASRDASTLTVNSVDSHPNEVLNREVAEMLLKEAKEQGW